MRRYDFVRGLGEQWNQWRSIVQRIVVSCQLLLRSEKLVESPCIVLLLLSELLRRRLAWLGWAAIMSGCRMLLLMPRHTKKIPSLQRPLKRASGFGDLPLNQL